MWLTAINGHKRVWPGPYASLRVHFPMALGSLQGDTKMRQKGKIWRTNKTLMTKMTKYEMRGCETWVLTWAPVR